MPEALRQQILFLCNEVEEAMDNQEFSSCNESQIIETIENIRTELGAV